MNPTTAATHIGIVYSGTTPLAPQYAPIAVASSGDNTVVAAVAGKKILVLAYNYMANGNVNAKWKSGASTDLTGLAYMQANTGKVAPFGATGWCITAAGQALVLNLSAATAVGGEVVYALLD